MSLHGHGAAPRERTSGAGEDLHATDDQGGPAPVLARMVGLIEAEPLARVDYVKMVDLESITQVEKIGDRPVLCAVAVYLGKTRLIDNFIFDPAAPRVRAQAEGNQTGQSA